MLNLEHIIIRHRHADEWKEMEPMAGRLAEPSDDDLEHELANGQTVYRCRDCDLEILVEGPSEG